MLPKTGVNLADLSVASTPGVGLAHSEIAEPGRRDTPPPPDPKAKGFRPTIAALETERCSNANQFLEEV